MTGEEMRELRKRHGMTQDQLAGLLGISREQVSHIENDRVQASEQVQARLSEWNGSGDGDGAQGDGTPLDALPEPPYDPDKAPPSADEDEAEAPEPSPRRRRRSSSPRAKKLTAWQEETAVRITTLIQGERVAIEVNGQVSEVVIPGLCTFLAAADEFDAAVVYQGAPALSVALVKVAPRHPWLRSFLDLLSMGGDYNELTRAVLAIAVPVAIHHGMIPLPRPQVQPAVDGAGPEEQ